MIKLNVRHTRLDVKDSQLLAEGNVNSIHIRFMFSPEWVSLSKIAVFSNGEVKFSTELSSDKCTIPWEVLTSVGEVFVSLRGIGEGGNFVICTETKSLGKVSKSLAATLSEMHGEATPDILDRLITDVADLKSNPPGRGENGKSAYELAVEHGFAGSETQWLASLKGDKGMPGVRGPEGYAGNDGYTPVKGVDYWTAEDRQGIIDEVLSSIPDGDEVSY